MIGNDSPFCPVSSFEKYLSILSPMNEYLFQRPKSSRQEDESHLTPSGVLNNIHKSFSQSGDHNLYSTEVDLKARHIMSVSGHRNESSIKTYSKTDTNTKTNMAGSLMAVIDNNKNHVVASEAGENDRNEELGLLTNSQEEFILRDLNVQTHNHCNQSTKQFNFYNCTVTFL